MPTRAIACRQRTAVNACVDGARPRVRAVRRWFGVRAARDGGLAVGGGAGSFGFRRTPPSTRSCRQTQTATGDPADHRAGGTAHTLAYTRIMHTTIRLCSPCGTRDAAIASFVIAWEHLKRRRCAAMDCRSRYPFRLPECLTGSPVLRHVAACRGTCAVVRRCGACQRVDGDVGAAGAFNLLTLAR